MSDITFSSYEWTMISISLLALVCFIAMILLYGEHREREQFKEITSIVEKRQLLNLTVPNILLLKLLHRREGTKETLKILTGVYHPQGEIPQ